MADPLAPPGQQLPPEYEQIITARLADFERTRVAGFQRLISERENENNTLKRKLRDQTVAGLTPEEATEFTQTELAEENARLRAQLEAKDLYGEYAQEAPFFERIIAANSTAEQLAAMRAFRESWMPAVASPSAPAGGEPPAPGSIDPNRPSPSNTSTYSGDGAMDEAMADLLLEGASRSTLKESRQR